MQHRSEITPMVTPRSANQPLLSTVDVDDDNNNWTSCFMNRHHCHQHRPRHRPITIAASILLFWSTVSVIPVYNKYIFQKEYYPYPIATAGIQLLCVSIILTCIHIGNQYYLYHSCSLKNTSDDDAAAAAVHENENDQEEWEGGYENNSGREKRNYSEELQLITNSIENTTTMTSAIHNMLISQNNNIPQSQTANIRHRPINSSNNNSNDNYLRKLRIIFPVGVLFGLKLAVTNVGLHLLPTPTHLLLQCTDIVWTVLGAWFINGEYTSTVGLICLCGCFVGTFILSIQVRRQQQQQQQQQQQLDDGSSNGYTILFAIGMNLLSPMLMGLCVSTLRSACVALMMDEGGARHRLQHRLCHISNSGDGNSSSRNSIIRRRTYQDMRESVGSIELTAIKTGISAIIALALASVFENARRFSSKDEQLIGSDNQDPIIPVAGWYHAFCSLSSSVKLNVLGGSLPTLIFQVNCTLLAYLTSTVAVGLVGQLKIIPQWIVAMIFSPNAQLHMTGTNIIGAFLTMTSAVVFAINEYIMQNSNAPIIPFFVDETKEMLHDDEGDFVRSRNEKLTETSYTFVSFNSYNRSFTNNYGSTDGSSDQEMYR